MTQAASFVFVPMLYLKDLAVAIDFYINALGATERWRISHEGRVHVAEVEVGGMLLRMHEETPSAAELSPSSLHGTSVVIHLLAQNPDELMAKAVAAGATVTSPMKDFEYGFRQGNMRDPFGHHWVLERMDDLHKKPLIP